MTLLTPEMSSSVMVGLPGIQQDSHQEQGGGLTEEDPCLMENHCVWEFALN